MSYQIPIPDSKGWRVVVETLDTNGAPYHNIYARVPGETGLGAIDYVLENYLGVSGGVPPLVEGWRVRSAWAAHESVVIDTVQIEPISQPIYKRRVVREPQAIE